jgi:ribosomal protein S18 acetylase RimI-like enzyme
VGSAISTVTLRPVTDGDRELLLSVYDAARAEELDRLPWGPGQREAFVRMQFDLQDAQYRMHNPHGRFDVVEVAGRPAGRLYVDRRPDDIRIVDIALLPELRGAGIGGHLIQALIDEAAASGRTVSIHVEVHNRAAGLYRRLGFVAVGELGLYRRMEWTPRAQANAAS